jgi:hypothetical protein
MITPFITGYQKHGDRIYKGLMHCLPVLSQLKLPYLNFHIGREYCHNQKGTTLKVANCSFSSIFSLFYMCIFVSKLGRPYLFNGSCPMKAATFQVLIKKLGIQSSYSRPRVSNDNPYSESIFFGQINIDYCSHTTVSNQL